MNIFSLGYNCEVEMYLKKYNKKYGIFPRKSSPFNWTVSESVLSVLRWIERGLPLFESIEVVKIKHGNDVIVDNFRCLNTGLISVHDLQKKHDTYQEKVDLLRSKYQHMATHLYDLVFKQRENIFLRRVTGKFEDWTYVDRIYKNDKERLEYALSEEEELNKILGSRDHKLYFLCPEQEYCNNRNIFFIKPRGILKMYSEYFRIIELIKSKY